MDVNSNSVPLFNLSKLKEQAQKLLDDFSKSKVGVWLQNHSLGNVIDKLTKYSSSSDPNLIQKALHLLSHPSEIAKGAMSIAKDIGDFANWAIHNPKDAAKSIASELGNTAKDAYDTGKNLVSSIGYAISHPKETLNNFRAGLSNLGKKLTGSSGEKNNSSGDRDSDDGSEKNIVEKVIDKGKEFVNGVKEGAKNIYDKITGKKATGSRHIDKSGTYNVDEKGQELIVRQPEAGRYTYLETGDGVVPADITSKLFDLGGNPDAWFQKQLAKNGGLTATIQSHDSKPSISIGDIYVQQPIGDADALARAINNELPNAILQQRGKR